MAKFSRKYGVYNLLTKVFVLFVRDEGGIPSWKPCQGQTVSLTLSEADKICQSFNEDYVHGKYEVRLHNGEA